MPIFLTQDQVYRLLQRESPQDAYPDGPPEAFFSTADQYSVAKVIADAYTSQKSIYDNFFPNTCDDRLPDHEVTYFGYTQDSALNFTARRNRLVERVRLRRRTTPADMIVATHTVIDPSILVDIAEWGYGTAGWMLNVSQLSIGTILNEFNGVERTGPGLCTLSAADYGMDAETFARLQNQAYTYEVHIYGYTLTADERSRLDVVLSAAEPARSQHIILDGLDPNDAIGGTT